MDGERASIAFALKKANSSFLFPTKLHSYPSFPFLLPTKKTNSLFRQNFKTPNEKAFKVEAETRALTRDPPPPPRELDAMEPPKPETNHESLAPNGDSSVGGGGGAPNGSGSEAQVPTTELTVTSSANGKKSVHWSPELVTESTFVSSPHESRFNPRSYFSSSFSSSSSTSYSESSSSFSFIETVVTVKSVLGRWGKKVGEATRKAENLAGNTWQHLKTSPSFTEAAMGRIAQGTKVLAEGGYEKIFLQTFEAVPEERLQNSFACYLSTSAGPVMGVLYISTAKVAYSSDNPISYQSGSQTEWSYYKVVIPLHELKAVNPSSNTANPAEKYIQVISVDNHEFWFMGFLNYEDAVDCLQAAFQTGKSLLCEA